jgi:ssDNA-binding replication factor A large subunit
MKIIMNNEIARVKIHKSRVSEFYDIVLFFVELQKYAKNVVDSMLNITEQIK